MNPSEVHDMLVRQGAVLQGHFLLTSGRHSDVYVQKQRVLEQPRLAMSLAEAIAQRFSGADVVAAPALGAIALGFAVAYHLNCRFVFTERADDDRMVLRRGQEIGAGERAVVVEDIITTGGSAAEVVAVCRDAGAKVLGVGALVDRSSAPLAFHLEALTRVEARTWEPDRCPLCEAGEPLDKPGSRALETP